MVCSEVSDFQKLLNWGITSTTIVICWHGGLGTAKIVGLLKFGQFILVVQNCVACFCGAMLLGYGF